MKNNITIRTGLLVSIVLFLLVSFVQSVHASSYLSTITDDPNLISFWRMGESSGSTFVDSKSSFNATIFSGVTLGATSNYISGDSSTAATFDGTNGYASAGDHSTLDFTRTQPFTITAIIKPNVTRSGSTNYWIYTKAKDSSPFNGLQFGVRFDGTKTSLFVQFNANYPTQAIRLIGGTDLLNGQTYLVGLTYDGSGSSSGIKMYVNGVSISVAPDSGNTTSETIASGQDTTASGYAAELGRWGTVGQRYKGDAKDIAIFNTAQSSTWMQTLNTLATGGLPTLTTATPTLLTSTSVTLNASITDIGGSAPTIAGFNYGPTTSYGSVASSTGTFGTGTFSQSLSGLTSNTTYHYQAFAKNSYGTTTAGDQTFTTNYFDNIVYTVNQSPRPQVFYDFDLDSDIDDVVDAVTLLNLESRRELDIVGAVSTSCNSKSAPAWIAIANYYGRASIPTGVNLNSPGNGGCSSSYDSGVATNYGVAGKTDASNFPIATSTQRQILAAAADNSIEYITTGDLSSVQYLLQSTADQYSSLNGVQLVAQKVRHIWIVAGNWPSGGAVSDFGSNPAISYYVLTHWPTSVPMIFDSITDGNTVNTGQNVMEALSSSNPARYAWELYFGNNNASNNRPGWSQLAILSIARGVYPNSITATDYESMLGGSGTAVVNSSTGVTSWDYSTESNHGYLSKILSDANFATAINNLILNVNTTPPTVSVTAPTSGATISGSAVGLTATASDDTGVYGVQFKLDTNTNIGSEDTSPPYSIIWNSTTVPDGTHTIIAVARDTAGNYATSTAIIITVHNNDTDPPIISSIASSTNQTSATITWTTDEAADSQVNYGTTASYGSQTTLDSTLVTNHSVALSGLSAGTTYHYQVVSKDASGNVATSSDQTFTNSAQPSSSGGSSSGSYSRGGSIFIQPSVPGCPTGFNCVANPTPTISPNTFTRDLTIKSTGSDVKTLQQFLITKGILASGNDTGYFGPLTQAALAQYQLSMGIKPAVGYFGPLTRAVIAVSQNIPPATPSLSTNPTVLPSMFTRDLYFGISGDDVKLLQKFLNDHQFIVSQTGAGSPGLESNYFGPATRDALIRFQTYNHIVPAVGYFGPLTRQFVIGQ